MAIYLKDVSRTFNEYLLIPRLTTHDCVPKNISLSTFITKYINGSQNKAMSLNIPIVTAAMQSVADERMAIALAQEGGLAFIYSSQSIDQQAEMIKKVKSYKAGFVISDSNLSQKSILSDAIKLKEKTGHSTIPITESGTNNSRLLGIFTDKDYPLSLNNLNSPITEYMTPLNKLITAKVGINLETAYKIIWENKLNCLPIIDVEDKLQFLTFRKDYNESKHNTLQLVDSEKRLMVGAAINTWDYTERVPALLNVGTNVLFLDSSDGYNEYQKDALKFIKSKYRDEVKVGAGNIVYPDAFEYLADAGADFIKIGIGGGSICTTREQKGIGRGQASAIIDIVSSRNEYYRKTGIYIPLCADGGIVHDYHIALAIAMGADFVMLGRYFARFEESPGKKTLIGNKLVKEHWGEGSKRSANWQRYSDYGKPNILFEEGVDSFVPYVGNMKDNLVITLAKLKATMISCGSKTIKDFQEKAILTIISASSIVEGSPHDLVSRPIYE